jgi:pimeloyl-ACP methyl ester carboxylesterase
MKAACSAHAKDRIFVFFDQLGCSPDSPNPGVIGLTSTLEHAWSVVAAISQRYGHFGVLGHSWGTFVALSVIARAAGACSEACFISPFPRRREDLNAALGRLYARYPDAVKDALPTLVAQNNGREMMRLILPSYVKSADTIFPDEAFIYKPSVNASVSSGLGDFDYSSWLHHVPKSSIVVQGDYDFISRSDIKALCDSVRQEITLAGVGHFPFIEDQHSSDNALRGFFQGGQ